jgi:hypothetical protein
MFIQSYPGYQYRIPESASGDRKRRFIDPGGAYAMLGSLLLSITLLRLQSVSTLSKGDQLQMWEFIRI